jgi:hypothetical protein
LVLRSIVICHPGEDRFPDLFLPELRERATEDFKKQQLTGA